MGAILLGFGLWIGRAFLLPGPAARLQAELHEVHTTDGTYLGRISSDDGSYVRLAGAATLTATPTSSGDGQTQFVVQLLASEPYGVAGDILINREAVVFVGSVAPDSQVAEAYRRASTNAQADPTDSP